MTPMVAKPHRPRIGTPEATMPQLNAHMGGNQVIGLKSSVTVKKDGLPMQLYFYIDKICCQLVFTA